MQDSSKHAVRQILAALAPGTLLDCPSGGGWLARDLGDDVAVDGIDLYAETRGPYRRLYAHDLDRGLPDELPNYDVIACCEGIEHFANPELFLRSAHAHLAPGGTLLVTTPNTWYPQARIQYLLRGFFPGFPCLVGKIRKGSHMHIMPWSFPQLYLFLRLAGFDAIRLHAEPLSRAKHLHERLFGLPQSLYCRRKARRARSDEERDFWEQAGSRASVYGRHLIVSARPVIAE